jgi:hypothetical protein
MYKVNFIFARHFVTVQNFVSLINGITHNKVVPNGMLRKVHGPKREKARGAGRTFQKE